MFFFFKDTATTEIYTLSLHDALPIFVLLGGLDQWHPGGDRGDPLKPCAACGEAIAATSTIPARTKNLDNLRRSEEHTSELQSRSDLVCRLLLEKKNQRPHIRTVLLDH